MSIHEDKYMAGGPITPESFRRKTHDRGITNDREERDASPLHFHPETDKYFVDRQTSTTDIYLYSKPSRGSTSNMSNPYLDRGYKMPYEISQNRYKEHVLGSRYENYNQNRPEALDGYPTESRPHSVPAIPESNRAYHNWPIGAHPLEVAHERRNRGQPQYSISPRYDQDQRPRGEDRSPRQPNYGESPRFEQRTYRTGRPDLGVERDSSVPYPQEPIRRSRYDYEQPPDIGFDPYKDFDKPKFDLSEEDGVGPHPGWLLLLRFNKNGEDQVQKALTFAGQISKDGGRVLGLAKPHGISIKEGGDGWVTFGKMIHRYDGQREIQQNPTTDETTYCVLAIYYPSLRKAQEWFDRDSWFKQKDFPYPYTTDCIALPLSTAFDFRQCKTLVMTEYPRISHAEFFRDQFSVPTETLMRSKFRVAPYIVKAFSVPTHDQTQRVARHFRGFWIKRNSIITVSAFDSLNESKRYFTDGEYLKCKEAQDRVSAPTTLVFDLEPPGFM